MKARIIHNPEIALCFGLSEEEKNNLSRAVNGKIKVASSDDLNLSVGALCEVAGAGDANECGKEIADEELADMPPIVILSGYSQGQLDRVLGSVKKAVPDCIRALITPNSAKMSLKALICELFSEHKTFENRKH